MLPTRPGADQHARGDRPCRPLRSHSHPHALSSSKSALVDWPALELEAERSPLPARSFVNASPTPFHAVANAVTSKLTICCLHDPFSTLPQVSGPLRGTLAAAIALLPPPPFATLTAHPRSFAELEGAGFTRLEETKSWPGTLKPGGKYYVTRNQSSIIAFSVPPKLDTSKPTGISIVG